MEFSGNVVPGMGGKLCIIMVTWSMGSRKDLEIINLFFTMS